MDGHEKPRSGRIQGGGGRAFLLLTSRTHAHTRYGGMGNGLPALPAADSEIGLHSPTEAPTMQDPDLRLASSMAFGAIILTVAGPLAGVVAAAVLFWLAGS